MLRCQSMRSWYYGRLGFWAFSGRIRLFVTDVPEPFLSLFGSPTGTFAFTAMSVCCCHCTRYGVEMGVIYSKCSVTNRESLPASFLCWASIVSFIYWIILTFDNYLFKTCFMFYILFFFFIFWDKKTCHLKNTLTFYSECVSVFVLKNWVIKLSFFKNVNWLTKKNISNIERRNFFI